MAFRASYTAPGGVSGSGEHEDAAMAWAWLYAAAERHGERQFKAMGRTFADVPLRVEVSGCVYKLEAVEPAPAADDFTAAPFNAVTVALREAHRQALETMGREGVPAWQYAEASRLAAMCEAALAGRGYAVTVKDGRVQDVTAAGPHAFDELADNLGGRGAFASSWKFYDVKPAAAVAPDILADALAMIDARADDLAGDFHPDRINAVCDALAPYRRT